MTSKISIDNRELLQKISIGEASAGIDFGNAIVRELAAFRLAAMDSKPVAYMTYKGYLLHAGDQKLSEYSEPMPLYADPRPASTPASPVAWDYEWASCITCEGPQNFNRVIEREAPPEWAVEEGQARNIIPLYRHAQPALSSEPMDEIYAELYRLREEVKGPDGLNTWRDAAIAEKKARVELERQINQSGRDIDYLGAMAAFHSDKWHKMDPITGYMHGWNARRNHAQPATVVPDAYVRDERGRMMLNGVCEPKIGFSAGWNACRAAMLQELPKSAGESNNCRSCENVQDLQAGNSPALSPSREHFIALCNEFWNWSEMDMIFADDKGYEPRIEWNGQSFTHPVTRGLWRMYQAANTGIPMNSNGWIPVSERLPEVGEIVLAAMGGAVIVSETECTATGLRFFTSVISGRELPATHWMPLPADPQEVNHG